MQMDGDDIESDDETTHSTQLSKQPTTSNSQIASNTKNSNTPIPKVHFP